MGKLNKYPGKNVEVGGLQTCHNLFRLSVGHLIFIYLLLLFF